MENKKIEKILELYNTIELYYNDLDSLAKRLQDNWNEDIEFCQEEQDRLALCMILDLADNIKVDKKEIEREKTKKVDTTIQYIDIERQVEIIRKDTRDYGETQILSYIEPMKKENFEIYSFYKNVLLFPELYLEYANIYPNNKMY